MAEPRRQIRREKLHAVVARSTFPSQNVQKPTSSRPLLQVGSLKNGTPLWREAHFQVKMLKTYNSNSRPLLEVGSLKTGAPLRREAHFQLKMFKKPQLQTTFGSWKFQNWHAAVARSTFPSENIQNTRVLGRFERFR